MSFAKVRKVSLVLMFGIGMFLIKGIDVRAVDQEFVQYTCTLRGSDTDIKVYVMMTGTLEFEATNSNYTSFSIYEKDGKPIFSYNDFKDGSCPNLSFSCSGSSCLIGCSGNQCIDPAKEVDKPKDQQQTIDKGAGEDCGQEMAKLDAVKTAISRLESNINAARYTGNTRVGADWLVGYESGVTSREADFKKALSEYEAIYKNRHSKCSGLINPDNYSEKYAKLMDNFYKYSEKIKNLINEAMTNTTDEDELEHLQEELEKVDGVSQRTRTKITSFLSTHGNINIDGYETSLDCEGLLGPNVLDDIETVLTWLRIGVPILLIILGSLDFGKAVLADDDKALSKSGSTFAKRAIVAVAVFLAPSIIMYLLRAADQWAGTTFGNGCDIGDFFGIIFHNF